MTTTTNDGGSTTERGTTGTSTSVSKHGSKPDANKTTATSVDVIGFLSGLDSEEQQEDCAILIDLMRAETGEEPRMWGPTMIGFGEHHYVYESGREGDAFDIGFAPRRGKLALYLTEDAGRYADELARLGRHTTGKACIYVRKLADVDREVLAELIGTAYRAWRAESGSRSGGA